jgi:nitrogen regulatory protein PII
MKAVFISFNQAYFEKIMALLDRQNIRGYTSWNGSVRGRGSKNGEPHYGSHAWPTMNTAILTIVDDQKVDHLLDTLHQLDMETEAQGLRAFVWNVEKTI